MAIIIASKDQINAYYSSPALNQSKLKKLIKGLFEYKKDDFDSDKSHFRIGTAIDVILTGNPGDFREQFLIMDIKYPTDAVKNIVDSVFKSIKNQSKIGTLDKYSKNILVARNNIKYSMNLKDDTVLKKVIEKGSNYFDTLVKRLGKKDMIILSKDEHLIVKKVVKSLRVSPQTKKFFDRKFQKQIQNADFYYQLPIYFTFKGVECKALLDLVVVIKDQQGKAILIEPYDLKSIGQGVSQFLYSFRKLRYDIQGGFYTEAIKFWANKDVLSEVQISDFSFIVESTVYPGEPAVFTMSKEALVISMEGVNTENYYDPDYLAEYRGILSLIDDYKYYEEHGWDKPRVFMESNGHVRINLKRIWKY